VITIMVTVGQWEREAIGERSARFRRSPGARREFGKVR
jgi:hypothetical protein